MNVNIMYVTVNTINSDVINVNMMNVIMETAWGLDSCEDSVDPAKGVSRIFMEAAGPAGVLTFALWYEELFFSNWWSSPHTSMSRHWSVCIWVSGPVSELVEIEGKYASTEVVRSFRGAEGCGSSCPHEAKSESRCKDWRSGGLGVQQACGPVDL